MGKVLEYSVETVSDDVLDWRLQVAPVNGKAQWYRERALSEQDEIVDRLIEARTGKVVWTAHRPARGWYLHLRSPLLPRDMAISLQPARDAREQAGTTPLSVCIATRLDSAALCHVDDYITPSQSAPALADQVAGDDRFTAVSLTTHEYPPSTSSNRTKHDSTSTHARVSSRNLDKSHARRRSAGLTTSSPTPRAVSKSSQTEVVHEEGEGGAVGEEASVVDTPQVCHFRLTDGTLKGSPHAKVSWARWAWSQVPEPVRTPLILDASKTFSLLWLNAPHKQHPSAGPQRVVEVLRFEDDTTWWSWKGKKRGRIAVQLEAVRALRLDLGFWVAVSVMCVQREPSLSSCPAPTS